MTLQPLSQQYGWRFWRVVWATLVLTSVIVGFWLLYRFNQAGHFHLIYCHGDRHGD